MIQTTVDESNENVRDNSFLPITDTIKPPYASIKNPIYTRYVDFQKTQKERKKKGKGFHCSYFLNSYQPPTGGEKNETVKNWKPLTTLMPTDNSQKQTEKTARPISVSTQIHGHKFSIYTLTRPMYTFSVSLPHPKRAFKLHSF